MAPRPFVCTAIGSVYVTGVHLGKDVVKAVFFRKESWTKNDVIIVLGRNLEVILSPKQTKGESYVKGSSVDPGCSKGVHIFPVAEFPANGTSFMILIHVDAISAIGLDPRFRKQSVFLVDSEFIVESTFTQLLSIVIWHGTRAKEGFLLYTLYLLLLSAQFAPI